MNHQFIQPNSGSDQRTLRDVHDSPNGERVTPPRSDTDSGNADWARDSQKLRARWESLTQSDLDTVNGDRNSFINRLAERQTIGRQQAERELAEFEARKTIGWRTGMPGADANGPQTSIGTHD